MLEKLFNSSTRVKILDLFFENKDQSFYTQQIIKKTKTDPANTHRELKKLVKLDLLQVKKTDQKVYYTLNIKSPYYWALVELFKAYTSNDAADRWVVLEEMPNYYPMMVAIAWNVGRANAFFKSLGLENRFSKLLAYYKDGMCSLTAIKKEFNAIAHEILEKSLKDVSWGKSYISRLELQQEKLITETDKLKKTNLAKLTNKQLYSLYKKYYEVYDILHTYHWIHTTADFGDNVLSNYLLKYIADQTNGKKRSVGEHFSILTTPTRDGSGAKEHKDLLNILQYIIKKPRLKKYFRNTETRIIFQDLPKVDQVLYKRIDGHKEKYGWIGYGNIGPGWDNQYFIDILCSLIRQNSDPKKLLNKLQMDKNQLVKTQEKLEKTLNIDTVHKNLFGLARDIVFTKGSRKDSMFYSYSVIENLFKEIGKRYYLSVMQVRYMYPHEFKNLLLNKKYSASKLNERLKYSLQYSVGKLENDFLLEGEKADRFLKSLHFIKEEIDNIDMLDGDCASPGRARGRVSVVNVPNDMQKVQKGDILVSIATNPDLIPAIKKASAIITDIGGITCHAAIVSRELNIPCVIGTKMATKIFKDGDVVDVDATHGKATVIQRAKK